MSSNAGRQDEMLSDSSVGSSWGGLSAPPGGSSGKVQVIDVDGRVNYMT